MLYTETIAPRTLELLKRIMLDESLPPFRLVGGTSLALQLGHRISIDLDLFTDESFDEQQVNDILRINYGFETDFIDKETVKGVIEGVRIDCIAHKYHWIYPFSNEEGIRIVSKEDICAMKLNAIAGNGTRIKDFIDIAFLSTYFTLEQMLGFYEEKYHSNSMMPFKALTYFEDINMAEPVHMIDGNKLQWERIRKRLLSMSSQPSKLFKDTPV